VTNQLNTNQNHGIKKTVKTPFDTIHDKCQNTIELSDTLLKELPTKWELLGTVVILKLSSGLKKYWHEIADVYAEVLSAKAVLRKFDKIHGTFREPSVELLSGENTETIHIENKIKFRFDAARIMFSSGNIDERIRISTIAKPRENIVDMFAGIGYFSLPLAVHSGPKNIIACELNPLAHDYLCQNIKLNHADHIVQPILGDNRTALPLGTADRILMGYLKSEDSHRKAAFKILNNTGGMIHFHDAGFKDSAIEQAFNKMKDSLADSEFVNVFTPEVSNYYVVKSYGPKLVHVVLDVMLKPLK
jgi:tRNA wybutosine-synthesizing protein 2